MADLAIAPATAAPAIAASMPVATDAASRAFGKAMAAAAPPSAAVAPDACPPAPADAGDETTADPSEADTSDPTARSADDPNAGSAEALAAALLGAIPPPVGTPVTVAAKGDRPVAPDAARAPSVAGTADAGTPAMPGQPATVPSPETAAAAQAALARVIAGDAAATKPDTAVTKPEDSATTTAPAVRGKDAQIATQAADPRAPGTERRAAGFANTAAAAPKANGRDAVPARTSRTRVPETGAAAVTAATPSAFSTGTADPAVQSAPTAVADQAFGQLVAGAHDGQFLDQLARDIARTGGGDSQLSFRLDPTHLGPLAVQIAQGADGASVRLSADDQHTRAILADAQPRLVAEARAQGLTLREASVDVGGQRQEPRGQAAWTQSGTHSGEDGQRRPAWSSPDDNHAAATPSPARVAAAAAAARYA